MLLKDVMTKDVVMVSPDANLGEAARKMKQRNVGALPVCDGNRLRGMLTDRDITVRATAVGRDPNTTKVGDVMTPGVVYCFEDQDVQEASKIMAEKQIRRLVILSQNKDLAGIVALKDLAVDTHDEKLIARTVEGISEP